MLDGVTRGPSRLILMSLTAFGLSTILAREAAMITIVLGVVTLLLVLFRNRVTAEDDELNRRLIFGILALFAVLSIVGPVHVVIGEPPGWVFVAAGVLWLAMGFGWLVWRQSLAARRAIFGLVLAATAIFGAVHLTSASGIGFDVFVLHEEAADAIADGLNPYSDAVMVPNGAPEGDPFIVGYPYPPITALSYSAGTWTFGDSRWTSLIGWLVALAMIGARSLREDGDAASLGIMLVAAAIPGWPLVLTTGWTEPFSLALIAVATALWTRSGVSGAMTGLFISSKQYLLAAVPLLAVNEVSARWRRAAWAGVALVLSFVPVLVWGVSDFVEAAVRFHLEAPARADGTSIVGWLDAFGIDWVPPVWLMVISVVGLTALIGRHVTDLQKWLAALGAILSTALILSAQAFPNYWFLMAGIAALAAAAAQRTEVASTDSSPSQLPV